MTPPEMRPEWIMRQARERPAAEQKEPVKRRVALKISKLGMDTKQVVARFEAERQALAMMDHPNIAKVLDAGTTDMGRAYFVMELVRGIRITDYCDEANLSTWQAHVARVARREAEAARQVAVGEKERADTKAQEAATAQEVAAWRAKEHPAGTPLADQRQEQSAPNIVQAQVLRGQDVGAIKSWLVLAPLPYEAENGTEALAREQIPQEAHLRPRAGERANVGAIERTWMAVEFKDGLLDFNRIFGEISEGRVGYAVCYVQSETNQSGLVMHVGSDDESE